MSASSKNSGNEVPGALSGLDITQVTTGQNGLEAFAREHGLPEGHLPAMVARPRDTGEVATFINYAREERMAVVPMSSSPPHALGLTLPERPAAVLDLRGMNRVVRTDRRNRVAIIEPGVTFGQLDQALAPVGLRAMTPLAPRADKSVLAAYLDRVPTLVPRAQWDLSDPLLCTEVIMGTGDVFRTGCASGPGTLEEQWSTGQAQKNPMGPSSFDFFRVVQGSRGSLAVVAWASIKCELRPRVHELILVTSKDLAPLAEVVYRLSRAKWGEECLILDRHCLARLAGAQGGPAYTLLIGVAGFDYRPEQRVAYQAKGIRRIIQEEGLKVSNTAGGVTRRRLLETINLPGDPYWKDAEGAHSDLYFLTTLDRAGEFLQVVEDTCAAQAYDRSRVGVYLQPQLGGRVTHFEASVFHSEEEAEAAEAASFTRALAEAAAARGAYFSRPAGNWADLAYADKPLLAQTFRRAKRIFDPAGVLNPGVLCFQEVV